MIYKPQQISILNDMKIVQVDSGYDFVAILTNNGHVFIASDVKSKWKTNNTFKLINPHYCRFKMIACGKHHLLMLERDGYVFDFGQITGNETSSYERMIQIANLKNIKLIVCGLNHSLSITNKGEIYSWFNTLYNKRDPSLVSFPNNCSARIKDIVAGSNHSLFLFENGQLWGCGSNYNGELGLGDKNNRNLTKIPIENVQQIACSKFQNFSLAYDGSSYYAWGKTKYYEWLTPRKLDYPHSSFASASALLCNSPITFGLCNVKDKLEGLISKMAEINF
ncbi:hypothetical protein HUG17_9343 [Dermatophagoides farinae]|uniref:Uncharacterized protein n=1 Tax=Dermatophagoides farinae TaxID=6954 RepID=A0A9D4NU93_DERFA|nr:RCC1 and BTB domain-containing protein 1-like [Dermatophagoides farinae]KAH7638237.1 hypothetical protein HUG17_9343 [Dermatophagoides farinae]